MTIIYAMDITTSEFHFQISKTCLANAIVRIDSIDKANEETKVVVQMSLIC